MKKNQAFTLAELLTVLVILGIISAITIPIVTNQVDKYRKKLCKTQYKNVLTAAKMYGTDHLETLRASQTITLGMLIDEGYIEKELTDPVTKKAIPTDLKISIQKVNQKYQYTIIDDESIGCPDDVKTEQMQPTYLCRRATTLHTEICNQTSATSYCRKSGYPLGGTITYGNLGNTGILKTGDAFDCDVDGNGIYDVETERFYYVSGLDGNEGSPVAVLIYYNSTLGGLSNNTTASSYDSSGINYNGPVSAKEQLPTTKQWKNVKLHTTIRAITNESNGASTTGGTLPTDFSYNGYAARLLTVKELENSCRTYTTGELDQCQFLMENTRFSTPDLKGGWWLENPLSNSSNTTAYICSAYRSINGLYSTSDTTYNTVRPAIEVNKTDMEI